MKIKPGASIDGCSSEILVAAILIETFFLSRGVDMVITEGMPTIQHRIKRSSHNRGDALDLRTRDLTRSERRDVVRSIKRKLGSGYVVILESNHIHMHWSPVYE